MIYIAARSVDAAKDVATIASIPKNEWNFMSYKNIDWLSTLRPCRIYMADSPSASDEIHAFAEAALSQDHQLYAPPLVTIA